MSDLNLFSRCLFDIEANGLLEDVSKVHCLVIKCMDTNKVLSCADKPGYDPISKGLKVLENAKILYGHNIDGYDIPVLSKIYDFRHVGTTWDSLIVSRICYSNLKKIDFAIKRAHLRGSHSLEAWGERLGKPKNEFGKDADWKYWTMDMQKYCEDDVEVNFALIQKLLSMNPSEKAIKIEHRFAHILRDQMAAGVNFDKEAAESLYVKLKEDRLHIENSIQEMIPPKEEVETFIPKVTSVKYGYKKGEPFKRVKKIRFNPGSSVQIVNYFKEKYDWEPSVFTVKGHPSTDGDVLSSLKFPEAELLLKYSEHSKIMGYLKDGKSSWLSCVTDEGKIHGVIMHNGARTHRCIHFGPNLGQVPSEGAFMGEECRSLFIAPDGYKMVGCDASGLELRMLSHYLYPYDGGAYVEHAAGKPHNHHMKVLEVDKPTAKRFLYAFMYGAGDKKLGSILGGDDLVGRKFRNKFVSGITGLGDLIKDVKAAHFNKGFVNTLDGRRVPSVSAHSALNTLLQSAGAIVMKMATIYAYDEIKRRGLDAWQVLHVHDEFQYVAREDVAEEVSTILLNAIISAGKTLEIRLPLSGEAKIGDNWAQTH